MKITTPSANIKNYFENKDHINQSRLKLLLRGIKAFITKEDPELYYTEKEHFLIGTGVDTLITQGEEEFNKEFIISVVEKPSDAIMSIIHQFIDEVPNDEDIEWNENKFLLLCREADWNRNWGDDAIKKNIKKVGEPYFDELVRCRGKQMISPSENEKIKELVNAITEGTYTHHLFDDDLENNPEIDVYYQVPIYFIYEKTRCRALLDMVIVDHTSKRITPYDIKTTSEPLIKFHRSARKFRYDIQAAFYSEAMKHFKPNEQLGYSLRDFKFIVASIGEEDAIIYECSKDFLRMGKLGVKSSPDNRERQDSILGFKNLIHILTKQGQHSMKKDAEIIIGSGELKLYWCK